MPKVLQSLFCLFWKGFLIKIIFKIKYCYVYSEKRSLLMKFMILSLIKPAELTWIRSFYSILFGAPTTSV